VDNDVRLNNVRNRNRRSSTFFVGKNQLAAVHHLGQGATLDRGQCSFTAALAMCFESHLAGYYVVGQNLHQGGQI
jgi:hypothetical protein